VQGSLSIPAPPLPGFGEWRPHARVLRGLHPSPLFAGFFERHFLRFKWKGCAS
jgi:hypothetical protein